MLTQMVGVGNERCPEGGVAPPHPPRPSSGLELITAHPDPAQSGWGCLWSGLVLANGRHFLCLCASLRLGPELWLLALDLLSRCGKASEVLQAGLVRGSGSQPCVPSSDLLEP